MNWRLEMTPGKVSAYTGTMEAITKALEAAGVEFTNDNLVHPDHVFV